MTNIYDVSCVKQELGISDFLGHQELRQILQLLHARCLLDGAEASHDLDVEGRAASILNRS